MTRLTAVVSALLLVAAACSGSGGDDAAEPIVEGLLEEEGIELDGNRAGSVAVRGVDGDSTLTFGGDRLPDDFPLPGPDEYGIASRFEFESPGGKAFSAVLEIPVDHFDRTLAMYDAFLRDEGFGVSADSAGDGQARIVFVHGTRTDAIADITMSGDTKGVIVSLTWTPSG